MTIYCFHEIGNQVNEWCIKPLDFAKFAKEHKNQAFHFDDGRKGIFTNWPLITQNLRRLPTIFMVPNFLMGVIPEQERYSEFMTIEDVRILLQLGWKIGSHGLSHRALTTLNHQELIDELQGSKKWLEKTFKKEVTELSLPYGAVSENVLEESLKIYKKVYGIGNTIKHAISRQLVVSS